MSDQHGTPPTWPGPSAPAWPPASHASAVPPPPPPPPRPAAPWASPDTLAYAPPDPATTHKGGGGGAGKGRIALVALVAVAVLGGGAFAAAQLGGDSAQGGASSPEAAVDDMLTALEDNDLLGMVDHLAPGERDVIRDSVNDYVGELKRLGLLSEDTDLSDVPGFDVSFDAMTYEVERRNDRVSMVTVTGGQVTAGSRIAELPLGDVILERIGDDLPPDQPAQTVDIAEATASGDGDPLRIAVITDDGAWYVSAFYTAAELAASEAGYEMPAKPIAAVGAASPEDAVVEMLSAAADADVTRVIQLTPPDEMAALHDYGQILVDQAADAIDEAEGDTIGNGVEITIDDYAFETAEVTGGTKVIPTSITATLTDADAEESITFSATKTEGTCVEWSVRSTSDSRSDTSCAEDLRPVLEEDGTPPELIDVYVRLLGQLGEVGFVTVEVGDAWYVSPIRTYNDLFLVVMQGLEQGDFEALVDMAG